MEYRYSKFVIFRARTKDEECVMGRHLCESEILARSWSAGVYYTHFPTINHEWSTETNTAIWPSVSYARKTRDPKS